MAALDGDLLQGQLPERAGQGDRDVAEADAHGAVVLCDVADGQSGDDWA
ncbi:hypothetical protein [Streptomyces sp900116325]